MLPQSTPEDRLCVLLGRGTVPRAVEEEALGLLQDPLQWNLVVERATAHGVLPLLHRNLRSLNFPGMPEGARAELAAAYQINALHNTLLAEKLSQVLRRLGEAGIPVIPLKGVALAQSLYGDISLRACSDIDILVRAELAVPALQVLLAEGYKTEFPVWYFAKYVLRNGFECSLLLEEGGGSYPLELHWGILWGLPFDTPAIEDLWAEAQRKPLFDVPAYAFSPEWELLFLVAHAARHRWKGLKWLVDIDELCCCGAIEWEKVREKADRLQWKELVEMALTACHTVLGTPLGNGFSLREVPPARKVSPAGTSPLDRLRNLLHSARLLGRTSDRFRYLILHSLVPTLVDRQCITLPRSLSPLYYVLRPLRLGGKAGWELLTYLKKLLPCLPSSRVRKEVGDLPR